MRQTEDVGQLYDRDFALWVKAQVAALRSGSLSAVDIEHVTEELEALAKRDRRELKSRLRVLCAHLLKVQFQPEKASGPWDATISEQASVIRDVLDDSPSLRREFSSFVRTSYSAARELASGETGLPLSKFPLGPDLSFLTEVAQTISDVHVRIYGEAVDTVAIERLYTPPEMGIEPAKD